MLGNGSREETGQRVADLQDTSCCCNATLVGQSNASKQDEGASGDWWVSNTGANSSFGIQCKAGRYFSHVSPHGFLAATVRLPASLAFNSMQSIPRVMILMRCDAMRCVRACMRPSSCSRGQLCQAPAGIVEEAVMVLMLVLMDLSMNHSFIHSLTRLISSSFSFQRWCCCCLASLSAHILAWGAKLPSH